MPAGCRIRILNSTAPLFYCSPALLFTCSTVHLLPCSTAACGSQHIHTMNIANLFRDLPPRLDDEFVQGLVAVRGVRIERIVSRGHASPEDFWYDQDTDEWVIVLKGSAQLVFERGGENDTVRLEPGDHIHIPAHLRHRIAWTDPDQDTIWLAVHFG